MDIRVNGQLTHQDIINAFFRHLKPTRNSILIRLSLLGLIALILIFSIYQGTSSLMVFLLSALVIVGISSPWWMPFIQAVTFNQNSPLLKPLNGEITDEGVNLRGNRFNSNMKWASLTYYKKAKDIVLLYQGPNAFNFLSRNLFNNETDWLSCLATIEKYLPTR